MLRSRRVSCPSQEIRGSVNLGVAVELQPDTKVLGADRLGEETDSNRHDC